MEQGGAHPRRDGHGDGGGRLSERDTTGRGFVLDGCPRTTVQAESLEEIVQPFGLDIVINLQVPTNLVMKRLASRRVCVDCGANYSTAARRWSTGRATSAAARWCSATTTPRR